MLSFNKFRLQDILGDEGGDAGGGSGDTGGAGDKGGGGDDVIVTDDSAGGDKSGGVDWVALRQSLPEDLRDEKSLSTITSVEGLAKSYVHSQKAMGSKVAVPDKHATPEDWTMFFNKVGNPEKIEDYNFEVPKDFEADDTFMAGIKEAAHSAGVLPWQMEKIIGKYAEITGGATQQQTESTTAQMEGDLQGLKQEWGDAFEDRKAAANVAFKELLPDESHRQRLIDDGLASHPSVARLLANAAKMFSEDKFIGHGEGKLGGMTPAEALAKATDIQGNNAHPYRDTMHPGHKAAQEEVQNLYKIAYPE